MSEIFEVLTSFVQENMVGLVVGFVLGLKMGKPKSGGSTSSSAPRQQGPSNPGGGAPPKLW